jgi:hypothetical protein
MALRSAETPRAGSGVFGWRGTWLSHADQRLAMSKVSRTVSPVLPCQLDGATRLASALSRSSHAHKDSLDLTASATGDTRSSPSASPSLPLGFARVEPAASLSSPTWEGIGASASSGRMATAEGEACRFSKTVSFVFGDRLSSCAASPGRISIQQARGRRGAEEAFTSRFTSRAQAISSGRRN